MEEKSFLKLGVEAHRWLRKIKKKNKGCFVTFNAFLRG